MAFARFGELRRERRAPPPGRHHRPTSPKKCWGRLDAILRLSKRDRNLPFLPRSGGEGPGKRGPFGRSAMPVEAFEPQRQPQPPPGFFGGGGRVVLARRGRSGRSAIPAEARSNSPLSARNERG